MHTALALDHEHEDLFRYTSGRWLYNEQTEMANRYVQFNVQALKRIAGLAVHSRCVKLENLSEGLYNKVFSLRMENGKDLLARIPNPNAGHPRHVVASEVTTLDFLRNVLDIPVPKIVGWSSGDSGSTDPVNAEYMLMKRIAGCQLSDVWPTMSEAKRFGLVKSVVEMEKKLTTSKLSQYGSIYYRKDSANDSRLTPPTILASPRTKDTSRFVIGPVTDQDFWGEGKSRLTIDRGPWNTAEEYFAAIAKCEIARIEAFGRQRLEGTPMLSEFEPTSPETYIKLLEQFLRVLPYILPPGKDTGIPVLWHRDLHPQNIFVDNLDPTKVTGVIDWQAVWAAPLFIQARFPSVFNYAGPYPWGTVQPKLPENFDSLSEADQVSASNRLSEERLKKFYEIASRKFNPLVFKALDVMRNENNPATYIFHLLGQTWIEGPVPLQELLIQIYEKWDWMNAGRSIKIPCPISFTAEEIRKAREQAQAWAVAFQDFNGLHAQVLGKDGWVPHEEYDEAMQRFIANKEALEELRRRLGRSSGVMPASLN